MPRRYSISRVHFIILTITIWASLLFLVLILRINFWHGLYLFKDKGGYLFPQYICEMFVYLLGNITIFLLPGAIWMGGIFKRAISLTLFLCYSCVISISLLIIVTTGFKLITSNELSYFSFFLMLVGLTLMGLMFLSRRKGAMLQPISFDINYLLTLMGMIVSLFILGWAFQGKIIWSHFDNNFDPQYILSIPLGSQNDVLEHFGLVDSLKKYLLPYWDLEYADKFGYSIIDPPLHAFTSLFLMLFFGPSYAAQSFNTVLIILINCWLVWPVAHCGLEQRRNDFLQLILPLLFLSYMFVFLGHRESAIVFVDHIHLMSLLIISQYYFLLQGRYRLFLIFALLAFLTKYEAALFTFLGLWFYRDIVKSSEISGRLLKKYLVLVLPYIILMAIVGISQGDLMHYVEAFFVERFMRMDYFNILLHLFSSEAVSGWGNFSIQETVDFLIYFCWGSLFLGVTIFFPQKDKISQFFSKVSLVYFVLIMVSKEKRVHYISPLVFMSAIVALRMGISASWEGRNFLRMLRLDKRGS